MAARDTEPDSATAGTGTGAGIGGNAAPAPRTGPAVSSSCPCLSGLAYHECCGRFHRGELPAPTAEALMRSRYSAFAAGLADYLLATWATETRPAELELDPARQWRRLDILRTERGGPLDDVGVVAFRAHYRAGGERGVQEETSRFRRSGGRWFYVDGT
ncbi:MAG TPA: YchJ family protein [Micrococcaceae bacterium]|jgi:SEC-C motif-containing protein